MTNKQRCDDILKQIREYKQGDPRLTEINPKQVAMLKAIKEKKKNELYEQYLEDLYNGVYD
jgi:hypothetical protein